MLDYDLAEMYGATIKLINEQVKRDIKRFPERYRPQIANKERFGLAMNCDRLKKLKHSAVNPYIFIADIIKSADKSILLIDNFIDEMVVYHFGASLNDLRRRSGLRFQK